jgi:hypothetical protein
MAYLKIGWCEMEDADAPDKELDLYMIRGSWPGDDHMMWLCEEHRP